MRIHRSRPIQSSQIRDSDDTSQIRSDNASPKGASAFGGKHLCQHPAVSICADCSCALVCLPLSAPAHVDATAKPVRLRSGVLRLWPVLSLKPPPPTSPPSASLAS